MEASANTDRELFREVEGDFYSPSVHVTADGKIGMAVGGTVIVRSIRDWHTGHSVMLPSEVYPIFEILPRLWSQGYVTVNRGELWRLCDAAGWEIVNGKTFRELCVNIVLRVVVQ